MYSQYSPEYIEVPKLCDLIINTYFLYFPPFPTWSLSFWNQFPNKLSTLMFVLSSILGGEGEAKLRHIGAINNKETIAQESKWI